jgi:hypothetical protein
MRSGPASLLAASLVIGCAQPRTGTTQPNNAELCAARPDPIFGPVQLDAQAASRRHGAAARTYADVPATREQPVEVCGVEAELAWLTRVTCKDGSAPFADHDAAHAARSGSVGAGGKCGTILDLYAVRCPEAAYAIHMDMYMCGPGERM